MTHGTAVYRNRLGGEKKISVFRVTFCKKKKKDEKKVFLSKKFIRFGDDKMNSDCKYWSVKLIASLQLCLYNIFTCNVVVWTWSSSSKIEEKQKKKEHKKVPFMENAAKTFFFLPKSEKLFYGKRSQNLIFCQKVRKTFWGRGVLIWVGWVTRNTIFFLGLMILIMRNDWNPVLSKWKVTF